MNFSKIKEGIKNPIKSYSYLMSIFNGCYYKIKYKLLKKNVQIGKNFKVIRILSIKGPGKVRIGDNVFLNGTRFGCRKRIEIGDNCIIADCKILDTDFHSILPDKRNNPKHINSEPIKIGNNIWIDLDCVILRGVTIGDNSTISAMSVVYSDVTEYTVYGGNPAIFIKEIPRNTC